MKDNGGAAFARGASSDTHGYTEPSQIGMSLRDYFAAHAGPNIQLMVFVAEDGKFELMDPDKVSAESEDKIAAFKSRMSYRIADAMLKARQ